MHTPATVGHNNPPEPTRDQLLMEWDAAKKLLVDVQAREKGLRAKIVATEFAGKPSGTHRVELGAEYQLKSVVAYNYTITKNEAVEPPDYSHVPIILAQLPADIAREIVRWKPSLNESLYKKLTKEEQNVVNQLLVIKPGSSTLEIEQPKPKK